MSRRRQARELVLGCLYAHHTTASDPQDIFADQSRRVTYDPQTLAYADRVFRAAIARADEIDRLVRDSAAHWDFARIGSIEKNILRAAIAELQACPETPMPVIIDEAVSLAQEYGGADSGAFVNGVLDAVYKRISQEEESSSVKPDKTGPT